MNAISIKILKLVVIQAQKPVSFGYFASPLSKFHIIIFTAALNKIQDWKAVMFDAPVLLNKQIETKIKQEITELVTC